MTIHDNELVGLFLAPGYNFVIALLGVLKAGKGFVPIDTSMPPGRIDFILRECNISTVLVDEENLKLLDELNGIEKIILMKRNQQDILPNFCSLESKRGKALSTNPIREKNISSIAYVIYTSGTTGTPKGVPISHSNIYPLMMWQKDNFGLGESTKTLQMLSLSFDFGIQEVLTTILFGGTLFFAERVVKHSASKYSEFINTHKISMIYSTPALLDSLVSDNAMLTINIILIGGQILDKSLVKRLFNVTSESCIIFNGYGPTEVSINATMYHMNRGQEDAYPQTNSIPIGSISANNTAYILDNALNIMPIGVVGELYLGGVGVSTGYINRPELNKEKFIADKFSSFKGRNLYKTGDLARYIGDGNIEFIGRVDEQIKIRGYRVEPGEIESSILKYDGVKDAAVTLKGNNAKIELIGYIVTYNDKEISTEGLQNFLRTILPSYMIPRRFIKLEALPLSVNGKVDYRKLPLLQEERSHISKDEKINIYEAAIIRAWEDVLIVKGLSVNDNFFELGGHSLIVGKVHASIVQDIGYDFPLINIFEYPTARLLSKSILMSDLRREDQFKQQDRAAKQKGNLYERFQQRQKLRRENNNDK